MEPTDTTQSNANKEDQRCTQPKDIFMNNVNDAICDIDKCLANIITFFNLA